jgi:hypothetical protein
LKAHPLEIPQFLKTHPLEIPQFLKAHPLEIPRFEDPSGPSLGNSTVSEDPSLGNSKDLKMTSTLEIPMFLNRGGADINWNSPLFWSNCGIYYVSLLYTTDYSD